LLHEGRQVRRVDGDAADDVVPDVAGRDVALRLGDLAAGGVVLSRWLLPQIPKVCSEQLTYLARCREISNFSILKIRF
jgi:hypothetical protein